MFSKEVVDDILKELKQRWGTDPGWEQLLRDTYLGMARADAGVDLGKLDSRVIALIRNHQGLG